jgi:hypothetical protein
VVYCWAYLSPAQPPMPTHHLGVGARDDATSLAAARQRDRRRGARASERARGGTRRSRTRSSRSSRRTSTDSRSRAWTRRSHDAVFAKEKGRSCSPATPSRQRAGGHRGVLPRHDERDGQADRFGQERVPGNPAPLEATLSTGTSATSRCSSRCRTTGRSTSSSPSSDPPADRESDPPGTLQDITCDSDGVIDRFAGGRRGKPCLELHPWRDGDPNPGIFLTGAYQEILGDLHTSSVTPTRSTSS